MNATMTTKLSAQRTSGRVSTWHRCIVQIIGIVGGEF
jgi:hypothetical protein